MRKEMRDATDAELNRALAETGGDLAKAKEYLETRIGVHGGLGMLSYQQQLNKRKTQQKDLSPESTADESLV